MAKKGGGGGGGSQLAQLKSKLRTEGITDRRQMKASAKKRKRGQAGAERDDAQTRRDRLAAIASSSALNPFEEKVTKPKNAVLGRKIRGATGKPGVAKMGGLRERSSHLLPEWMNRDKSGAFIDRRFGENSNGLSNEEIMLERFTREQQQRRAAAGAGSSSGHSGKKINLFNLDEDDEDENGGMMSLGQSLNDFDAQDDDAIRLPEEDMDERRGRNNGMSTFSQREDDDDEERPKSKAEVMKEVIAKSKAYKHERQQTKMADEDLRQELDDELGDIRGLLLQTKGSSETAPESNAPPPMFGDRSKQPDAYDAAVREMAFERRAKPQDRLKTEEEKAEDLASQLRDAEEKRLKRMRGEDDDGDDDDQNEGRSTRGRKSRRQAGGDDLEDDFELDGMTAQDVYGLGTGLRQGNDEEEEEDESSEEEEAGSENSGQEEGSNDGIDDDDDDDEEDFADIADLDGLTATGEAATHEAGDEENLIMRSSHKGKKDTLPYTFDCPASIDDLLDMIDEKKVKMEDIPLVVKRIRALHHPSLAEVNKFKLQTLIGVLIDFILHASSQMDDTNRSSTMQIINELVPQLFTLTKSYPVQAAEHFVGKLSLMQRNLGRGLSRGASSPDARTWPGVAECIFLKITGHIWPTSDRTHAVTTPLMLLLANYLSSCRIRNIQDVARGLFVCSLVSIHERQSARLVPEALNFLHTVIALLAPITSRKRLVRLNQRFGIPWPEYTQEMTSKLCITGEPDEQSTGPIDFIKAVGSTEHSNAGQMNMALLSATFTLVDEFATLYMGSVAFVELMEPFRELLADLIGSLPMALEAQRSASLARLSRAVANATKQRRALRLQAHRAIPLASHIPKFDQGFDPTRKGGKTFDPDAARAEQAKLRALLKKERKGAVRELRRDNEFLSEARRQAREEEDKRYGKAIDKIMGSFSAERGEEKAYLKEKQKLKRRAGKK